MLLVFLSGWYLELGDTAPTDLQKMERDMELALELGELFFHFVGGFGLFLLGVAAISSFDIYKKKNDL